MKVAALYDAELRIEERDTPIPARGEVLVRVTHCGICGSDLHAPSYGLDPGRVLGHEITGEIVDVGAEVDRGRIGERVAALPLVGCGACGACLSGLPARCRTAGQVGLTRGGGFAEFVTTGDRETFHLPDEISVSRGALAEPMAIGLHLVRRSRIEPTQRALVIGAGPVGLAVVAWLRVLGVRSVWASDPVANRRELAVSCGADGTIDPTTEDVTRTFRSTERARPDVVFDCAGARLLDAIECAASDATVVSAAYHHTTVPIDVRFAMAKEINLVFASWYTTAEFTHTIAELRRDRLCVDHLVTNIITLDELPEAFAALRKPNDSGKVLISCFSP